MARLKDIPLGERKMMEALECTGFEDRRPWVAGPPPTGAVSPLYQPPR